MSISAGSAIEPTEPARSRTITVGPLRGLPVEVAVLSAVAFFVAAGFGIW
jgi:hypothetical protein